MTPEYKKKLTIRFWEKVTKSEYCWEWNGVKGRGGYGRISVHGRYRAAHRVAWQLAGKDLPDGMLLDHICHNPACVNIKHLRLADTKRNAENLSAPGVNNRTGHRGVTYVESRGLYEARVGHFGKNLWAGYHHTADQAASAARQKRNEVFTHNDSDR